MKTLRDKNTGNAISWQMDLNQALEIFQSSIAMGTLAGSARDRLRQGDGGRG